MKIQIRTNFNENKWLHRLFPQLKCKHNVVSVEEGFETRYGVRTSYKYCLNCGRSAMELGRSCQHDENCFGICRYCLDRISKFDCKHDWVNEPDTDEYYCDNCGEWKDV